MQKCLQTAKSLFRSTTIFALSIWSLQSHAGLQKSLILENDKIFGETQVVETQGPRTGGGGNACALGITQNSRKLMNVLEDMPKLLTPKQRDKVFNKISKAKFYIADGLIIKGEVKDAINYPEEIKIEVSPKLCRTDLLEVSGRAMGILFHEYLGLAKIPDEKHEISGPFLEQYGELMTASAALQQSDSNLLLAKTALQGFLKAANNPKSEIGKKIIEINDLYTDGRNPEGAIDFPITKDSVQLVVEKEENIDVPWHYSGISNNKCTSQSATATYLIFLNATSNVHYASEFETIQFKVRAQELSEMKILKPSPDLDCEDSVHPSSEGYYGEVKKTFKVKSIEYIEPTH